MQPQLWPLRGGSTAFDSRRRSLIFFALRLLRPDTAELVALELGVSVLDAVAVVVPEPVVETVDEGVSVSVADGEGVVEGVSDGVCEGVGAMSAAKARLRAVRLRGTSQKDRRSSLTPEA